MSAKIIINAISTVLAMGLVNTAIADDSMQNMSAPNGMEKCYGVAKAGMNDCGTATHNCAGEAKTSSDKTDWIQVPNGVCAKIANSIAPEKK